MPSRIVSNIRSRDPTCANATPSRSPVLGGPYWPAIVMFCAASHARDGRPVSLVSGEAAVTFHGKQLATLGRGDYFDEIALINEGARSATVTATTDGLCFGLRYWELRPPRAAQRHYRAGTCCSTLARRLPLPRRAEGRQKSVR